MPEADGIAGFRIVVRGKHRALDLVEPVLVEQAATTAWAPWRLTMLISRQV